MTTYNGGKGKLYQKIINLMPPHQTYVEPFVGGGAVLLNKRPALRNVAFDLDAAAVSAVVASIAGRGDVFDVAVGDALVELERMRLGPADLVYCDPPYLFDTRKGGRRPLYACEFGEMWQHEKLLSLLIRLPCMVMISAYPSELYALRLAGWWSDEYRVQNRQNEWATEVIWMNYPPPVALHDYSHLGDNFRERERIRRKRDRWARRLQSLDSLERRALLAALQDAGMMAA